MSEVSLQFHFRSISKIPHHWPEWTPVKTEDNEAYWARNRSLPVMCMLSYGFILVDRAYSAGGCRSNLRAVLVFDGDFHITSNESQHISCVRSTDSGSFNINLVESWETCVHVQRAMHKSMSCKRRCLRYLLDSDTKRDSLVKFSRRCVKSVDLRNFKTANMYSASSLWTRGRSGTLGSVRGDRRKRETCVFERQRCNRWFRRLWRRQQINTTSLPNLCNFSTRIKLETYSETELAMKMNRLANKGNTSDELESAWPASGHVLSSSPKEIMLEPLKSMGVSVDLVLALYENTHSFAYNTRSLGSDGDLNVADIQRELEDWWRMSRLRPLEHLSHLKLSTRTYNISPTWV